VTLPLSIAVAGLGLVGIFWRRDRQTWHDRAASSAVVYHWDARAARLRWLDDATTPSVHTTTTGSVIFGP
jgi:hypothetical protein